MHTKWSLSRQTMLLWNPPTSCFCFSTIYDPWKKLKEKFQYLIQMTMALKKERTRSRLKYNSYCKPNCQWRCALDSLFNRKIAAISSSLIPLFALTTQHQNNKVRIQTIFTVDKQYNEHTTTSKEKIEMKLCLYNTRAIAFEALSQNYSPSHLFACLWEAALSKLCHANVIIFTITKLTDLTTSFSLHW